MIAAHANPCTARDTWAVPRVYFDAEHSNRPLGPTVASDPPLSGKTWSQTWTHDARLAPMLCAVINSDRPQSLLDLKQSAQSRRSDRHMLRAWYDGLPLVDPDQNGLVLDDGLVGEGPDGPDVDARPEFNHHQALR